MVNASNEFTKAILEDGEYQQKARITLSDGTILNLDETNFTVVNNEYNDGTGVSSLPLGVAIERSIQLEIMNDEEQFSDYDFFGAEIYLYIEKELTSTTEVLKFGYFTVVEPEVYGNVIQISAVDDMYKQDVEFDTSSYTSAITAGQLLNILASDPTRGFTVDTLSFRNSNYAVYPSNATNVTRRQLIGYIASIACGNARFNRNRVLEIVPYDLTKNKELCTIVGDSYQGGRFSTTSTPYSDGDSIDGGNFTYKETTSYDGGNFSWDSSGYHLLYDFSDLTIDTDDIVITGFQLTGSDEDNNEISSMYGNDGYVISCEIPILPQAQSFFDLFARGIGQHIVGYKVRKFSGTIPPNPFIEFMDNCIVYDSNYNIYPSIATDVSFQFKGATTVSCNAQATLRHSSANYSASVQSLVKAKEIILKEQSEREREIDRVEQMIADSDGMYYSSETVSGGGTKYYMHNKSTRAESTILWTFTADAVTIQTRANKSANWSSEVTALTADGTAILSRLYAKKITADYINGGTLTLGRIFNQDGTQVDGTLIVRDASGNEIARIDKNESRYGKNTIGNSYIEFSNGEIAMNRYPTSGNGYSKKTTLLSTGYMSCGFKLEASTHNKFENLSSQYSTILNISDYFVIRQFDPNANPYIYKKPIFGVFSTGSTDFSDNITVSYGTLGVVYDACVNGKVFSHDGFDSPENSYSELGDLYVCGDLEVEGDKPRSVDTENYGQIKLYAYETPTPMFGDIGCGKTDRTGICIVEIEEMFSETVTTDVEYQVFLQKEGQGDLWVSDKKKTYFVVEGTPELRFSWEVKCIQKENEWKRLEHSIKDELETSDIEFESYDDYERIYEDEIEQLLAEQESVLYETVE